MRIEHHHYGSVIECIAGEDLVLGDRVAIRNDGRAYCYLVTKDWRWIGKTTSITTYHSPGKALTKVAVQVEFSRVYD